MDSNQTPNPQGPTNPEGVALQQALIQANHLQTAKKYGKMVGAILVQIGLGAVGAVLYERVKDRREARRENQQQGMGA